MTTEHRLINLVISGFGTQLHREKDLIKITEKDGETTRISPHGLEQVIMMGDTVITSEVVRLLIENNVDLVFIGGRHSYLARVVRCDSNFITDLWRRQITLPDESKLKIGKEILDSAIYNKIRMIQQIAKNRLLDFAPYVQQLHKRRSDLAYAESIDVMMGIEGDSTRTYFDALRMIIPEEFGFERRERHPPPDPTNSMLGYGYTVLQSRVERGLLLAGLNPYDGIIHASYRNRPSLSFDLTEEFRQPIVDRVVITQIVRKQVSPDDFVYEDGGCFIFAEEPERAGCDNSMPLVF